VRRWRAVQAFVVVVAAVLGLGAPQTAGAASTLRTGFLDGDYQSLDPTIRAAAFERTKAVGSTIVRLNAMWSEIAPGQPTPGTGSDAGNPAYDWASLDAAVRDANTRSLEVLITVNRAPRWAEGAGRPSSAPPGSWKPDVAAYQDFVSAAAERYSGRFPDPLMPSAALPRVRNWQIWNEPNLDTYLGPQWVRRSGRWVPQSPADYRRLLNAGYEAVKRADPRNTVVSAGTAPYGDPAPGGRRMPPARFWRELLCLQPSLRPLRCGPAARFDVAAHHPYSVGGPYRRALNPDDVTVPDLAKLKAPLGAAVRARTALPALAKPLWVTEISWDSSPPDPDGVPARRHAAWVAESFHQLWRQGVRTITWLLVTDAPPEPSFASTYQSGMFQRDGSEKLAARAFRLPLVARRVRGGVRYWCVTPLGVGGTLERQVGGEWRVVRRLGGGVAEGTLRGGGAAPVRVRSGDRVGLTIIAGARPTG
jgi:hypothetical protein